MSERDAVAIRTEIAAERKRLDDHLTALEGELLTGLPLLAALLGAAAALSLRRRRRRKKPTSVTIRWTFK